MKYHLKFLMEIESVRVAHRRWYRSLGRDKADRRMWFDTLIRILCRKLKAEFAKRPDGPFAGEASSGTWFLGHIRRSRAVFEIIVTDIQFRRPIE